MSCVWQGLCHSLKLNMNAQDLFKYCKANNRLVYNVQVNGESLSEQLIKENYIRIQEIADIKHGYLCSTCDPLLILIANLFDVDIVHDYNGVIIKYQRYHKKKCKHCISTGESSKFGQTIYVYSNSNHFWA